MTEAVTVPTTQFYTWSITAAPTNSMPQSSFRKGDIPLLLIHPIVWVIRHFWHRFCCEWYETDRSNPIYNPDLLGCGESDMPRSLYPRLIGLSSCNTFGDGGAKPVILLVQGALLPVAIALVHLQTEPIGYVSLF